MITTYVRCNRKFRKKTAIICLQREILILLDLSSMSLQGIYHTSTAERCLAMYNCVKVRKKSTDLKCNFMGITAGSRSCNVFWRKGIFSSETLLFCCARSLSVYLERMGAPSCWPLCPRWHGLPCGNPGWTCSAEVLCPPPRRCAYKSVSLYFSL